MSRRAAAWRAKRRVALAAAIGGLAGALIPLAGGRLMGGSLDLLARTSARFGLARLGALVGERGVRCRPAVGVGGP